LEKWDSDPTCSLLIPVKERRRCLVTRCT
jgi:hypothetical protein